MSEITQPIMLLVAAAAGGAVGGYFGAKKGCRDCHKDHDHHKDPKGGDQNPQTPPGQQRK
jgi:hypothetical protein